MSGTNGKIGFNEATTPDKYYGTFEVQENGSPVQLNKAVIVDSAGQEVDVAREGKDVTGASMPAGGVGIRGWLSAIFLKLGTTLSVSGQVEVMNLPATQAVSAASLPLPSNAATEQTLTAIKTATEKQSNSTIAGGKIDGETVASLEQLFKSMIVEQRLTNLLLVQGFELESDIEDIRKELLEDVKN